MNEGEEKWNRPGGPSRKLWEETLRWVHVYGAPEWSQPLQAWNSSDVFESASFRACYIFERNSVCRRADFTAELPKLEAPLTPIHETLESVYYEHYIARKREALDKAGVSFSRLEIEPKTYRSADLLRSSERKSDPYKALASLGTAWWSAKSRARGVSGGVAFLLQMALGLSARVECGLLSRALFREAWTSLRDDYDSVCHGRPTAGQLTIKNRPLRLDLLFAPIF